MTNNSILTKKDLQIMHDTGIKYLKNIYNGEISVPDIISCLRELPKGDPNKYALFTVLIGFLNDIDIKEATRKKIRDTIIKEL